MRSASFVESNVCRHLRICGHFGEKKKWASCAACDVCAYQPAWLSEPLQTRAPRGRKKSKSRSVAAAAAPSGRQYERTLLPPEPGRRQDAAQVDPELREFLREWRREIAKEQNTPAFVVMHDTTLDAICAARPASIQDLLRITGIGERKAELYGRPILDALGEIQGRARALRAKKNECTPTEETIQLIEQGKSLEEIAAIRGRAAIDNCQHGRGLG